MTAVTAFEVGQTYSCHMCGLGRVQFTIVKRTPKFVTVENRFGETARVGVRVDQNGIETAMPTGTYSMAPVLKADNLVTD